MGYRETYRPLNSCGRCGHTWYPRGRHRSKKCPNCGYKFVSVVGSDSGLSGSGIVFILSLIAIPVTAMIMSSITKKKENYEYDYYKKNKQVQKESQNKRTTSQVKPTIEKEVVIRNDVDDLVDNFNKPKETPPKKETEFEKRLREREEERQRMEEERQETEWQIAEQKRQREKELVREYVSRLHNKFSMKLRRKSGKKLQTLYVIKKICKDAGVPFAEKESASNIPDLKKYKVARFQVKRKSYDYALRMMASSASLEYEVTKDGVVLYSIK